MSTNFDEIDQSLLSSNTVASGVLAELQQRTAPEDYRTRRFGYNPGFLMQMDPVHSGLQLSLIIPGVLHLFETGPKSKQNWSVDALDNSPPDVMGEFLAGEGCGNVATQNSHMGWREVLSLRGMNNQDALTAFGRIHPRLSQIHSQRNIIPPCPYELDVCMTCRLAWLEKSE